MKISSTGAPGKVVTVRTDSTQESARVAASAAAVVAPDVHVGAQTVRVQAAQAQLAAMPDVDAARVAEIKAALARGEITFDPKKLAQLVVRHHGGKE